VATTQRRPASRGVGLRQPGRETAPDARRPGLYSTHVGKKYAMAVSGMVLMLFVLAHMIGNLKLYLGASSLDT
jgi:succinate dehydrogenase / fumarate reductase cytochrome b subunit